MTINTNHFEISEAQCIFGFVVFIEIFNEYCFFGNVLSNIILKIAIILIVIAGIIQVIHIPSNHNFPLPGILQNSDIITALLITQYLFAITGIFLIVKFIIDKIFNKK